VFLAIKRARMAAAGIGVLPTSGGALTNTSDVYKIMRKLRGESMSRVFNAHYGGVCDQCGIWFDEGTPVRYASGWLVGVQCGCGEDDDDVIALEDL
jgi:hypothetical protein